MRVRQTAALVAAVLAASPEAASALTVIGVGTSSASTVQQHSERPATPYGGLRDAVESRGALPEAATWGAMSLALLGMGSLLRRRSGRIPIVTD